tara:strand:- start:3385 stop:4068 length:684 start_codon:yes stop_codon:yes gene_type:complete
MSKANRKYVLPGDPVAEASQASLTNLYKRGEQLFSSRIGMAEVTNEGARVIALSGTYFPRVDDVVMGIVVDHSAFAWEVDINSCFFAFLPAQSVFGRDFSPAHDDLSSKFSSGDLLAASILAFDRMRDPLLSVSGPGFGKIPQGEVVKIPPPKVPRLIGKKGSMIRMIESASGARLSVGQNGMVVITGNDDSISVATKAIRKVDDEAHTADLNQRVEELLGIKSSDA